MEQKKIAVINDFSGFGRCSIAVSLPIISAMKIQCCPLPTAIFSNHTGYDSFWSADFTKNMRPYFAEWEKLGLKFNGIATGFLGSAEQIDIVSDFLETFKDKETVIIVDPVMGDHGKLYPTYTQELADRMRHLVQYADIITPNLTEACSLIGIEYNPAMSEAEMAAMCEALSQMGPTKIVVSGLEVGDKIGNFIYQKGMQPQILTREKVGEYRSGTGDVFSAIIAADSVNGVPFEKAVQHAAAFIAKSLKKTIEFNIPLTDGIAFEEFLSEINDL